jgi:hypothetical protein
MSESRKAGINASNQVISKRDAFYKLPGSPRLAIVIMLKG